MQNPTRHFIIQSGEQNFGGRLRRQPQLRRDVLGVRGAGAPCSVALCDELKPIAALLAPPKTTAARDGDDPTAELRQLLDAARRVDRSVIELLHQQLDAIRRLDRRLGSLAVRDTLNATIRQIQQLATYSLAPGTREPLTALLSEMHHFAGWQALDLDDFTGAWQHYGHSRSAAAQSHSIPHELHAMAGQAIVLREVGAAGEAVGLLEGACRRAGSALPRLLRSWLVAMGGEALAAHGDRNASLRAFDRAAELLPCDAADERPYVAHDSAHLVRWRGAALAHFGEPEAIAVFTDFLTRLDPAFVRVEARNRIPLARALAANGERKEARTHAEHAARLATQVGSARLRRLSTNLLAALC